VTVTTVVPGLMRTGSHLRALFAGHRDQEFTWFGLGASLPLVSMDAERAARQIVAAAAARRAEVILTPLGQAVARTAGVFPELTAPVLHLVHRLALPAPARGVGQAGAGRGVPGQELRPAVSPRAFGWLTTLGRAAARRFNQTPGRAERPPAAQPDPGRS
jgi:hypothetical protein